MEWKLEIKGLSQKVDFSFSLSEIDFHYVVPFQTETNFTEALGIGVRKRFYPLHFPNDISYFFYWLIFRELRMKLAMSWIFPNAVCSIHVTVLAVIWACVIRSAKLNALSNVNAITKDKYSTESKFSFQQLLNNGFIQYKNIFSFFKFKQWINVLPFFSSWIK